MKIGQIYKRKNTDYYYIIIIKIKKSMINYRKPSIDFHKTFTIDKDNLNIYFDEVM